MLDADRTETILHYLSTFEYASLQHVTVPLLWHTAVRVGAAHALDDGLADAHWVLDTHAASDTRRIDVETARTVLADELEGPKNTVEATILKPLERHDGPSSKRSLGSW